jgi:uncharacterized spore protein YtfJ
MTVAENEHPTKRTARKQDEIAPAEHPAHPARPEGPPPHEGRPYEGPLPRGPLAFLEHAQDVMTVRRVFGEPIERDGVTIIPAASVGGGGGGGGGEGPERQGGRGWGGGFGVGARPAGVYVIRDGVVKWKPAIDLNRTIFMGQVVAIVFLLTVRSVVKALAKRR